MVDLLVSFIMLQSRPNTLTWPRGCYRSATGWMRRISNKFTAALIKCSSCSITQDGRTPFQLALISNNKPVLDVFLSGDMEDAPPGLLHDAIALSFALGKWDFAIADILLDCGATELPLISFEIDDVDKMGESRLGASVGGGWYRVADFLHKLGAVNPKGLVIESIESGPNMERLKWLLNRGFNLEELDEV